MSELRWILLLLGVLLIAAVYGYTRCQNRARGKAGSGARRAPRAAPGDELGDASEGAPDAKGLVTDSDGVPDLDGLPEIDLGRGDHVVTVAAAAVTTAAAPPRPTEDLLIMHVRADEGAIWSGSAIMQAAEAAGLRRADGDVFQCFLDGEHALFYVTNMFKPGVFDWRRMDDFQTRGLSLFMRLPATCPATEALKAMLGCAAKLTEILGGDMLDAERRPLSEEALARMRTLCEAHDAARATPDQPRA